MAVPTVHCPSCYWVLTIVRDVCPTCGATFAGGELRDLWAAQHEDDER